VSDAPLLVAGLVARVGVPVDGVQVDAVGALLDPFIGSICRRVRSVSSRSSMT
jgi:hypothetical protein